ncbi:MAG: transporter [Chthoniobacter sp.]
MTSCILALTALLAAGSPASGEEQSDQELVKQLNNPVSSLISVPFQSNWDFRMGPLDAGWKYTLNFQPVVPVSLNDHWNLIIRTIVPYIHQDNVFKSQAPSFPGLPEEIVNQIPVDLRGKAQDAARNAFDKAAKKIPNDRYQDGLGDITQSFFISPKETVGGWTIGVGPVFLYPTATDDKLGTEKWGAGPTFVVLRQQGGWTYGMLANHLWSFAGDNDRRSVNSSFVQPFIAYATKSKTTFTLNTESTYDWNESQWTVPVNVVVSQLTRIGKLPVQFAVGGRYYAEGPSGAPEWGLRFVVTPLFPAGGKPAAAPHDGKTYAK